MLRAISASNPDYLRWIVENRRPASIDVNLALIHKNVHISVDDSVVDWLLKRAEEESNSGARPLRRAIQRHIEDEISEFMIRQKESVPERIEFLMNGNEIVLVASPKDVDLIAN